MAYTKMTLDGFKQKLKAGEYKDATGARRGAGKAELTEDEKAQARKAIDKHFGVESAPQAAPKKTQTKVKASKKAASNGKAHAAPAKKGPGKGGRKRRVAQQANSPEDSQLLASLGLAKERIGTITQAVETMKKAKEAYPQLDTSTGMTAAAGAITEIIQGVHTSFRDQLQPLGEDVDPEVLAAMSRAVPASVGLPGQESPVQMPQDGSFAS